MTPPSSGSIAAQIKQNPFMITPPQSIIRKIEILTPHSKCIKNINSWKRIYWFDEWSTGLIYHKNMGVIKFRYEKRADHAKMAGVTSLYTEPVMIDDSSYYTLSGSYDVQKGEVTVMSTCLNNM